MEKLRDILLNLARLPSTDHGFTQCNWIWFNGMAITGSIDIYLCITKDEPLSLSSLLPLLTDHYWGWFRVGNNKVRSTQSNNGATKFPTELNVGAIPPPCLSSFLTVGCSSSAEIVNFSTRFWWITVTRIKAKSNSHSRHRRYCPNSKGAVVVVGGWFITEGIL